MTVIEDAEKGTCSMPRSRRDLFGFGAAAGMAALLDAPRIASAATVPSALPVVDVKSHGASGDGVKDDTAAFQHALDAAHAQGGGTVYAPPGRYLFHGTLNV